MKETRINHVNASLNSGLDGVRVVSMRRASDPINPHHIWDDKTLKQFHHFKLDVKSLLFNMTSATWDRLIFRSLKGCSRSVCYVDKLQLNIFWIPWISWICSIRVYCREKPAQLIIGSIEARLSSAWLINKPNLNASLKLVKFSRLNKLITWQD